MSYLSVPEHGTLRVECGGVSDDGRYVALYYTGNHDDLIGSGVVTAEQLEIRPRRRRDQMTGHQCFVLNRQWRERDGLAVRHYRLCWSEVPRERLSEYPGGDLALRQYQWQQMEWEERQTVVAPAAEREVQTEVNRMLSRFMRPEACVNRP